MAKFMKFAENGIKWQKQHGKCEKGGKKY